MLEGLRCIAGDWSGLLPAALLSLLVAWMVSSWAARRVGGAVAVVLRQRTYGARFRLPPLALLVVLLLVAVTGVALAWRLAECLGLTAQAATACMAGGSAALDSLLAAAVVLSSLREIVSWRATGRRLAALLAHDDDPLRRLFAQPDETQ